MRAKGIESEVRSKNEALSRKLLLRPMAPSVSPSAIQARLSSKCNTPEALMRSEPTEAFSWAVINQVNYYLQLSIWQ